MKGREKSRPFSLAGRAENAVIHCHRLALVHPLVDRPHPRVPGVRPDTIEEPIGARVVDDDHFQIRVVELERGRGLSPIVGSSPNAGITMLTSGAEIRGSGVVPRRRSKRSQ